MNLIAELQKAGASWSIDGEGTRLSSRVRRPGELPHLQPRVRVTLTLQPGTEPVVSDFPYRTAASSDASVSRMLAVTLKEHAPEHPALKAWFAHHGSVPVVLDDGALASVSVAVHTALRKCSSTDQRTIAWNAIHEMHSSDAAALWEAIRLPLEVLFKGEKPVTRRQAAKAVSESVCNAMDKRRYVDVPEDDPTDGLRKRNRREAFALLAMTCCARITTLEDWMWGWLGFMLKAPPEADSETPATTPSAVPA